MRGMQISLATRPKPRASVYERGLTNLSTSQRTYANHQVIFKLYACGEHKCYTLLSSLSSHTLQMVGWGPFYSPKVQN
jgi:hypothetical protein